MSRLVRARPKAVEYLPEWVRCCPESISEVTAPGEYEIDLDREKLFPEITCRHCFTTHQGPLIFYSAVGKGFMSSVDTLDLDEGPIEPEAR